MNDQPEAIAEYAYRKTAAGFIPILVLTLIVTLICLWLAESDWRVVAVVLFWIGVVVAGLDCLSTVIVVASSLVLVVLVKKRRGSTNGGCVPVP
jgi:sugar phosphate permease